MNDTPDPADSFFDSPYPLWTNTYMIDDRIPIVIEESWLSDGCIGSVQWQGGVVLANDLAHKYHNHLSGCTFLELGAGLGLLSIVACKLGAHCIATDMPGDALDDLRENIALNIPWDEARNSFLDPESGGTIRIEGLLWGPERPEWCPDSLQFIVAAECMYNEQIVEPLFQSIVSLCCNETTILVNGVLTAGLATFKANVLSYFNYIEILGVENTLLCSIEDLEHCELNWSRSTLLLIV